MSIEITFFPDDDDGISPVVFLADIWCDSAIAKASIAREARTRFNSLDRAYEHGDDDVDTASLMRQWRRMWLSECEFVWSGDAAQQWLKTAFQALGEAFDTDHELRRMRDALEHLQGASFEGGRAVAVKQRDWALRELNGISIGNYYGSDRAFRDLDVARLERFLRDSVRRLRTLAGE
jgi:hypothetical protein